MNTIQTEKNKDYLTFAIPNNVNDIVTKIENEFNLIKNYKPKQGIKQTVRKKEKNIPTLADAFKDENE